MQMAAAGLGMTVVASLMGVMARRISLEAIPVGLLAVYAGLTAAYLVAMRPRRLQEAAASAVPAAPAVE
jgi:hypothetical protein